MNLFTSREDWSTRINDAFDQIKDPDESIITLLGLIKLSEFYGEMKQCAQRNLFCDEMVKLDFVALAKRYIIEVKSAVHHKLVLNLLCNTSNASKAFCESIIDNQIHEIIIANLQDNEEFQKDNLNICPKQEDTFSILHAFLGIINNTLRNFPDSRSILSATKLKHSLKKLLDVEDLLVRSVVVMCLPYVVDVEKGSHQDLISLKTEDLEFLIKHILPTTAHAKIDDESLANYIEYGSDQQCFSSDEIFQPLAILATNPKTARELVKLGIVSACESALKKAQKKPFVDTEHVTSVNESAKWALELLLRLTKNLLTGTLIDFQDVISKFTENQTQEIARIATELEYILTMVQQNQFFVSNTPVVEWKPADLPTSKSDGFKKQTPLLKRSKSEAKDEADCKKEINGSANLTSDAEFISITKSPDTDEHKIMISYCHAQEENVMKLLKKLREKEVGKIWIDDKHMHMQKSILSGIVKGVDGAKFVICCISQEYHKSENCMCEIEYAKQQKKIIIPVVVTKGFMPEGELSLCLGSRFRFDLSTEEKFELNFPKLLEKIEEKWNKNEKKNTFALHQPTSINYSKTREEK